MKRETWAKFDEIDYLKEFSPNIRPSHQLLEYAFGKYKPSGVVLDLGGGPAITAEMLIKIKNDSISYNIDPTKHCTERRFPNYRPIKMTLGEAIERNKTPERIDVVVACNSLHEIALSNQLGNVENKRAMFEQINTVLRNLRKGGLFIAVFIEYRNNATDAQIKEHMMIASHNSVAEHPKEELFSIQELKKGLNGMELIETRRKLQTHRYKNHESKVIWSKLAVFRR